MKKSDAKTVHQLFNARGIPNTVVVDIDKYNKSNVNVDYNFNKSFFDMMMRAHHVENQFPPYYVNMMAHAKNGVIYVKPVVHSETANVYGICKMGNNNLYDCDLVCKYFIMNNSMVTSKFFNEVYATWRASKEKIAPDFEHVVLFTKDNEIKSAPGT